MLTVLWFHERVSKHSNRRSVTIHQRRLRRAVASVGLAAVAVSCEYDPSTVGTVEALSQCAGVDATHGFGYNGSQDPPGGSNHVGTNGDDVIVIANGPVTVDALGGDDTICINAVDEHGPDAAITVRGGLGDDTIIGNALTIESCFAETISGCDSGNVVYVDDTQLPAARPGWSDARFGTNNLQPPGPDQGVTAFRTRCGFSHMLYDDPIVAPNQPGGSHLHTFFGNTGADAASTTASLTNSGDSTCDGGIANRSAYWVPTMIDTATGAPIVPDHNWVYYKSGWHGIDPATLQTIPAGLRMIAGDGMAQSGVWGNGRWSCPGSGGQSFEIPANCAPGSIVEMTLVFPQCWDGVNLDSPDHQSHMAVANGVCPPTHPVPLPEITYNVDWIVPPGHDTANWRLTSDNYDLSLPGGYSAHGDWWNGWDQNIAETWTTDCHLSNFSCTRSFDQLADGSWRFLLPFD